jgi:hypothetical protein
MHRTPIRRLLAVAVLGAALAAVAPAVGHAAVPDACSLLTPKEIKKAFKTKVKREQTPRITVPGQDTSTNSYCQWAKPNAPENVSVEVWDSQTGQYALWEPAKMQTTKAVAGVGDEAFVVDDRDTSRDGSFYARVGDQYIAVNANFFDTLTPAQLQARTTQLGTLVVGRL